MNFAERLKQVMRDESVLGFAKKSGLSEGAIRQYLKGGEPGIEKVIAIANATGVSVGWLATGDGQPEPISEPERLFKATAAALPTGKRAVTRQADLEEYQDSDSIAVPLVNLTASAGPGAAVVSEQIEDYVRFSGRMLRHLGLEPGEVFLMPALGDSMEPRIRSGELMLCSRAPQHLKGVDGTYIARLEGDILVKRIQRLPGGKVVVSSENPSYSPFEVTLNDGVDFAIIGLVVLVLRRV